MQIIKRQLQDKLLRMAQKFPFVTLTGPRQSGKSTLARIAFPEYTIVSLEDLDMRAFAIEDPRGFIKTFPEHVIIDEVQRVPSLLSYLQTYTDQNPMDGRYVLTGSQNGVLMDAIDQSLAGRTALLTLLPLSCKELYEANLLPENEDIQMFTGGYPAIYAKDIPPIDYFPSYISTYVERDVRQILAVTDLLKFVRFIKLCAGRIGTPLNKSSLAVETGISVPTVDAWLSVLESSYIIYLLPPYFNNFNKRLVKSPVLYFYDTALACSLLEITSSSQLSTHFQHGHLFENMVINEFLKNYYNQGIKPCLAYWRDSNGQEVDLIDYTGGVLRPYEIKSGSTYQSSYFDNLKKWGPIANVPVENRSVIYAGVTPLATSQGSLIPWQQLIKQI